MIERERYTAPIRINYMADEEPQHSPSDTVRWRIALRPHVWRPATDVYETDEAVYVRVEIAGMRETDFSISLVENYLTIRGVRPDTPERRAYHQLEIPFGEFSTEVEIPCPVEVDHIEAVYRNGLLSIMLPKVRPQQVRVQE